MGHLTLFLSPHLDDAALSCPTCIQRRKAVIATVFTEPQHRQRRAEDRRAAKILGATPVHLGFDDAPFRSTDYRDFMGIVFGRATEYRGTRRRVASAIESLVASHQPATVFAPLAVGNHVDHRMVRDAALSVVAPSKLWFYEDRPYAFIPEQVAKALRTPLPPPDDTFWQRYFNTSYIRAYLGCADRDAIRHKWIRMRGFPAPHCPRLAMTVKPNANEAATAIKAIDAYRSQLADLFADRTEIDALYRHARERFYQV